MQFCEFVQYVPAMFVGKFVKKDAKDVKVQTSNGKAESIKIFWRPRGGCFLSRGWAKFSNSLNLKDGDICIFELLCKHDVLFKLSVFHGI